MHTILVVILVVLTVATLAVLWARGRLQQYEVESPEAALVRYYGYGLLFATVITGVYIFGIAEYSRTESPAIPWLAAVGFLATTIVGILMFFWWRDWYAALAQSKRDRAYRRQQNKMVP